MSSSFFNDRESSTNVYSTELSDVWISVLSGFLNHDDRKL